ncbi:rCG56504 [Rattus norvegicus]|uniref:RCG56504 n=1 Tax=Rattus norvegicus TaxID=10116 RepID=A6IAH0_RAT|nr:rCG56504 [Rattus norvegicus]
MAPKALTLGGIRSKLETPCRHNPLSSELSNTRSRGWPDCPFLFPYFGGETISCGQQIPGAHFAVFKVPL